LPELPDIAVYLESLERRILGARLVRIRLLNPFLLRTAVPPIASAEGKKVASGSSSRSKASSSWSYTS